MQRIAPAVVYLGPTLPREVVAAALPGADIRPPVRRGDLHRDRMLRYSLFILIDGVFFQDEAVSLREVVDILEDGAVVLGASSMGALRAAELWPAGMQGVGSIYRLYRRGALVADDEVAVVFDPEAAAPAPDHGPGRCALGAPAGSAVRRLERQAAEALVARAVRLSYAERTWQAIAGGSVSQALLDELAVDSLKSRDALALAARARGLVQRDPTVLRRPRRNTIPFEGMDAKREALHHPAAWLDKGNRTQRYRRWLLATGRADAQAEPPMKTGKPDDTLGENGTGTSAGARSTSASHGATVMRFAALSDAIDVARAMDLKPDARHLLLAEAELVRAHGAADWSSLLAAPPVEPGLLIEHRAELALAKCWRERLFRTSSAVGPCPDQDVGR
ncbi:MAG: TfuA-like protein [Geminicoccaceae bacterium]